MFIVIEGLDGAGKGTQVELLQKALVEKQLKVGMLDYPRYSEPSSYFVSQYLNGRYGGITDVNAQTASLFYALDRYDSRSDILTSLQENDITLANRYVSSNLLYQTSKFDTQSERDTFVNWNKHLEFEILGLPEPDKVFLLSISPEGSYRNVQQKAARNYTSSQHDIHEANTDYLRRVRENALHLAQIEWWTVIDVEDINGNMKSREAILAEIVQELKFS
jgi:dTMP kinase